MAQVAATQCARLWLWRPCSAIVLTSRERALAETGLARSFAEQGWPVVVRDCGGGPVALGPACLNVSWMTPVVGAMSIEAGYIAFCDRLSSALASLGIQAYCNDLPGSYCDGRFNLLVDGRKLAGTAQRIYSTASGPVRLSQAVVHVTPEVIDQLGWLNRFLALARAAEPLSPQHLISVADAITVAQSLDVTADVFAAVSEAMTAAFASSVVPPRRSLSDQPRQT